MGLSIKEIGRLTLRMFFDLYKHYKDNFDLELKLKSTNTTYAELPALLMKSEEWL